MPFGHMQEFRGVAIGGLQGYSHGGGGAARKIAREVASEEDKESARETAYTDGKEG